jgi:hypothetical protein
MDPERVRALSGRIYAQGTPRESIKRWGESSRIVRRIAPGPRVRHVHGAFDVAHRTPYCGTCGRVKFDSFGSRTSDVVNGHDSTRITRFLQASRIYRTGA